MCIRGKTLLALYVLIKTTSGTWGERPFLGTLLTILLLAPCCLAISDSEKSVNTKQVSAVSKRGSKHQRGFHQAPEQPQKSMKGNVWWTVAITGAGYKVYL